MTKGTHESPTKRSSLKLALLTAFVSGVICFLLAELLISIFSPQRMMFPRREYSAQYGFQNYRNTETVHEVRGEWKFVYTTNEYRNRGEAIPLSNSYTVPNVVVLGDSNTFGVGVADGEEFSSVMQAVFDGRYNVTNLGVGGWGLTQQIRRFYEFGQLYEPEYVVIQFSENDLRDNLNNRVTVIRDGRFEFVDSASGLNWVKKYLSRSWIQKSQTYNLLRDSVYTILASRHIEAAEGRVVGSAADAPATSSGSPREQLHFDLLSLFLADLSSRGIEALMISEMPDLPPFLQQRISLLERDYSFRYVKIDSFLNDLGDFSSPEGHRWGARAHRAIGENLAGKILELNANTESSDQAEPIE